MYLLDANILLEYLLDQERADEVEHMLKVVYLNTLAVSDFAFHAVGLIASRSDADDDYLKMTDALLVKGGLPMLALRAEETERIVQAKRAFGLDFDDAYQYAVAEKHDLTIVSFDTDFDKTDRGRVEPKDVVFSSGSDS